MRGVGVGTERKQICLRKLVLLHAHDQQLVKWDMGRGWGKSGGETTKNRTSYR